MQKGRDYPMRLKNFLDDLGYHIQEELNVIWCNLCILMQIQTNKHNRVVLRIYDHLIYYKDVNEIIWEKTFFFQKSFYNDEIIFFLWHAQKLIKNGS